MATQQLNTCGSLNGHQAAVWNPLANGDVGAAVSNPAFSYGGSTIQVNGTFGVGGSCQPEGSNDGINWYQLHDMAGAAIAMTAAGLKQIAEAPIYLRPHCTAGDGTTALTVIIAAKHRI